MKPSIAMRFAKYVVWILLCKHCTVNFTKKFTTIPENIEFY